MRDSHIKAIEQKIYRIKTYKRIGKMLLITVTVIAGINLVSNIDDAMTEKEMQTVVLSEGKELDNQSIDQAEKVAVSEEQSLVATYNDTNYTQVQDMVITHYCLENYTHICNDGESHYTASGEKPIPDYTVAADKSIPFGTKIIIDGQEYEVMDRGGAIKGNRLDIAVKTHDEAINRGKIKREVQIEKTAY